ncbi:GPP34 family phosphoprotein [Nocardiopsis flavescens]|uniref:GPP34 family phosphoprotein n=1 Tax=Nocardiopsis flavescens TaxID=758803 RepID=UPI00366243E6
MDLTLPQWLYLLSYDTDRNRFDPVSSAYRGSLLRAAALAELAHGGWLRVEGGRAARNAARPPGDRFLADVLEDLSPRRPTHWVTAVSDWHLRAERAVSGQLVANGTASVDRGRVLGVFPTRRYTFRDTGRIRLERHRTRDAVLLGGPAEAVPFGDMALAVIGIEGDVETVLTARERRGHRDAVKALQRRFDAELPGLREAVLTAVAGSRAAG